MKSIKNLLIPFIILIALVIGVVIYYAVENARIGSSYESSAGAVDVVFFNSADLSSVTVYNRSTAKNIIVNCISSSDGSVKYDYAGDDVKTGDKYSQSNLYNFVNNMTYFSSSTKVSSSGNYAEYGLDNPKFIITINTNNGSATTVYLGNTSPDGNYCYMSLAGSNDIYLVSSSKLEVADMDSLDFLDPTVLDIELSEIKNVHFDRTSDKLSLDAVSVDDGSGAVTFNIVKPYNHAASTYFTTLISHVAKLQISDYLELSKDDLAGYGLDKPVYHFILTLNNGQKKELYISSKIKGYYYGYINGMNKYFKLSDYQIEGVELQELVLIDPNLFTCRPYDYSSITCTYADMSFKLILNVNEGKSVADFSSNVLLDGRNAKIDDSKGRSYCSILFESLSGIKIGGIEIKDNLNFSSAPVLTLSFNDKNYNTTTYEFYTRNSDTYYAFKDGEYLGFYVYAKELFYNAGTDTYNYGCWSAYELLNEAISNNINGIYDIQEKTE